MRLRASLFTRILFWSFLYLAGVGGVLYGFFALQFRLNPDSILFAGNRLQFVVARLSSESRGTVTTESWDALLKQYSTTYQVDFLLFAEDGTQLAGTKLSVPPTVIEFIRENRPAFRPGGRVNVDGRLQVGPLQGPPSGPPQPSPSGLQPGSPPGSPPRTPLGSSPGTPQASAGARASTGPRMPGGPPSGSPGARGVPGEFMAGSFAQRGRDGMRPSGEPIFRERTADPTRYWVGLRIPVFEPGERRPSMGVVVVASDSMSGRGLFFDVRPWLFVSAAIVLLTVAIWFPFVRGLTHSIGLMTATAEEMARGRFDVRVERIRSDELGRLGAAINQLSGRLSGFVGGQRRFLGDISHELNSPLARLDVALGIVEERVGEDDRAMVADAQEEVRLMAQLVAELLAFAKAGMKEQEVRLSAVLLRAVCDAVVAREAQGREVQVEVDADLAASAQPQLLARALANLVRNAIRYAGHAGPISVSARREGDEVAIAVRDAGPGVPAETIPRLFEPFFRIEADRDRATGGAGLGLAIVKTCVDACQGRVSARNLSPGFEVEIRLRRA